MAASAAPGEAKTAPADLVRAVYDALEAGDFEVLADDTAKRTKAGLSTPVEAVYPQLTTPGG